MGPAMSHFVLRPLRQLVRWRFVEAMLSPASQEEFACRPAHGIVAGRHGLEHSSSASPVEAVSGCLYPQVEPRIGGHHTLSARCFLSLSLLTRTSSQCSEHFSIGGLGSLLRESRLAGTRM
jgi:hypothetical protein